MTVQVVARKENEGPNNPAFNGIQKIQWDWTADSVSGVIVASLVAGENPTTQYKFSGQLVRLITKPGTGDDAPSAGYDVTILDEDSFDVLMGAGLNRSATLPEQVLGSSLGTIQYSTLSLRVADAGVSNKGTVIVYII